MTDALTGIANRRQFDELLALECKRAARHAAPLGLAIMDVDWFKPYNDRYGHPAGDACLRQIAQALATALGRPTDVIARYGGEEFVLLAPMSDLDGTSAIAQRLLEAVRSLQLAHADSPFGEVTLSIGVAALLAGEQQAQVLMQRADAALYRAKQSGRNRVEG